MSLWEYKVISSGKGGFATPALLEKFLNDLGRDSDVKVPWELSRLQWLIPVGEDYALGGDRSHPEFVRDVVVNWIEANPFARSVNWGIAMEPAMRIFSFLMSLRSLIGLRNQPPIWVPVLPAGKLMML